MLYIYICEYDEKQREVMEKIINNILLTENYDIKLELSTSEPNKLLIHAADLNKVGLYFLGIDLNTDINGIRLASKIREFDPRGFIVFITNHIEMSYITFTYKVEAMDYILKGKHEEVMERIHECINIAYKRHIAKALDVKKFLYIKVNGKVINIEFNQILFIETSHTVHKLILHVFDCQIEFYAKMKDMQSQLDKRFYRCHNSYIVNKDYIKEIDINNRCVYMTNGEKCLCSVRLMKGLLNL